MKDTPHWREEFDKIFGDSEVGMEGIPAIVTENATTTASCDEIKDFIESLLAHQKQQIVEELERMKIKGRGSITIDYKEMHRTVDVEDTADWAIMYNTAIADSISRIESLTN